MEVINIFKKAMAVQGLSTHVRDLVKCLKPVGRCQTCGYHLKSVLRDQVPLLLPALCPVWQEGGSIGCMCRLPFPKLSWLHVAGTGSKSE